MSPMTNPKVLEMAMRLAIMKLIFGFLLLSSLIILAAVIAIGKVTEAESHGLMPLVTALATLAGGFSNWAFGHHEEIRMMLQGGQGKILDQDFLPSPTTEPEGEAK